MDRTSGLGLPLLQPSQAQKHVTVNEALLRLDALAQLVLESRSLALPPALAPAGACYAVPEGAGGAWAGRGGEVAVAVAGGWDFAGPAAGWRAFIRDEGAQALHDGTDWRAGQASLLPSGAGLALRSLEIVHVVAAGEVSVTAPVIPGHALVLGVTGRVTQALAGTLASWSLGTEGAADRFGSGLGTAAGSWLRGVLAQPMAYYAPTPLVLTAEAGAFAGGAVRLVAHVVELGLPEG